MRRACLEGGDGGIPIQPSHGDHAVDPVGQARLGTGGGEPMLDAGEPGIALGLQRALDHQPHDRDDLVLGVRRQDVERTCRLKRLQAFVEKAGELPRRVKRPECAKTGPYRRP